MCLGYECVCVCGVCVCVFLSGCPSGDDMMIRILQLYNNIWQPRMNLSFWVGFESLSLSLFHSLVSPLSLIT